MFAPRICVVSFQILFDHSRIVMENLFVLGQILSSRVGYRHGMQAREAGGSAVARQLQIQAPAIPSAAAGIQAYSGVTRLSAGRKVCLRKLIGPYLLLWVHSCAYYAML